MQKTNATGVIINKTPIGPSHPVYFIADIAANHCGDLNLAKELIHACAESGVNAVKMQNFTAPTIVSDYGFKTLTNVKTHQSSWKQSVFESYAAASIPLSWTRELKMLCDSLGMDYFTSSYSMDLTDAVAPYVAAFKVGSGDITWHEHLAYMATLGKPVLIATGASTLEDVTSAMDTLLAGTDQIVLFQCNTNYTASIHDTDTDRLRRFENINLKVLHTYAQHWPQVPLGLSDHTHGHLTVLGAVGLFDCCAVEKHFTLDNTLEGQDHVFSMTPDSWRKMVDATADLKSALGGKSSFESRYALTADAVENRAWLDSAIGEGDKKVEENERQTIIVQRRAIRALRALSQGTRLTANDLCALRPCPEDALPPYQIPLLLGKTINRDVPAGDCIRTKDMDEGEFG
jgi:N-acetylneuraminate synthase